MAENLPTEAMQEAWTFYKQYATKPFMSDSDWDNAVSESGKIWLKFKKDKLVGDVLCAYLEDLQRRFA